MKTVVTRSENLHDESFNHDDNSSSELKCDDIEFHLSTDEGIKFHRSGNYKDAWNCFVKNAELNDRFAKYWKGYYLWEGHHVSQDKNQAAALFKDAAEDGVEYAQLRYAFALKENGNTEEIANYLTWSDGSAEAQYHMGCMYLQDNPKLAYKYFSLAASQNNARAKKQLEELKESIQEDDEYMT
ncbi:6931_t:CDS:2 [Dentiscutata erythropus]|uniref:6931_t:CDS:1 n=1 Tax=Dentiscutata erythropus TaxID=1348616 RepID=A0A9N8Z593_9GLOM|nr:6931_t:CDS:2 [Dentiscutata erythropus]